MPEKKLADTATTSGNSTLQTAEPEDNEEQVSAADDIHDVMINFIPWIISLLVHAGIVLLTLFLVWSTIEHGKKENAIIPIAELSKRPNAPLQVQKSNKVSTQAKTQQRRTTQVTRKTQSLLTSKVNTKTIGVIGSPQANDSPFEQIMRSAGSGEPQFFGTGGGGNIRSIAYVIDASGSLIDTLPFVLTELKRSILQLDQSQKFTLIFFQANLAIEIQSPRSGLRRATPKNKQIAIDWLDNSGEIVPKGGSNPIKAIKLALQYRPDLIFILSDNITGTDKYEVDQQHLLDEIMKANTTHTKINTIQFIYRDKLEKYGLEPTLDLISQQNAGRYKFLDSRELGIHVN